MNLINLKPQPNIHIQVEEYIHQDKNKINKEPLKLNAKHGGKKIKGKEKNIIKGSTTFK